MYEIVEDYELQNGETRDVAVYRTENNASEGGQETFIAVSKHLGIVRRELVEDEIVWNLIDYHVIQ